MMPLGPFKKKLRYLLRKRLDGRRFLRYWKKILSGGGVFAAGGRIFTAEAAAFTAEAMAFIVKAAAFIM